MKLGFISDLHLSENMPSITEGFFDFLHTASQELSHLYILGDLFESWIGDDDDSEYALKVIKKIITNRPRPRILFDGLVFSPHLTQTFAMPLFFEPHCLQLQVCPAIFLANSPRIFGSR